MTEFTRFKEKLESSSTSSLTEKRRTVLILYTGGTIGSTFTEKGYAPTEGILGKEVLEHSMLFDKNYKLSAEDEIEGMKPHPLPLTFNKCRIMYYLNEYNPLLDSSNMSMVDWSKIATDINNYYKLFDSFVILHGTDTMCYTASALSFMLEDLGKTVILTGSQIPLSELRNDARDNLLGALIIAGEYQIPEVMVYFNNKLYRGNRTVKMNSSRLDAFTSPNIPPLAKVGTSIEIDWDAVFRPTAIEKFKVHLTMNPNVGVLRLFPGISLATVRSFLQPPMEGVVIQSYGAGNMPDLRKDLMKEFLNANERGMILVNCSQCASGHVTDKYAAGRALKESGVVPGHDMTPEAALTKLSYLLEKSDVLIERKRELMEENIRGELTVLDPQYQASVTLKDSAILQSIIKALRLNSSKEVQVLRQSLLPPVICTAAAKGDVNALDSLRQQGGDFNMADYSGLTPLHVAAREGHSDAVLYLLKHGASVHLKDSFNHNPLYTAIKYKHYKVIELLVKTGAQIQESSVKVGVSLCQAAFENDISGLKAWHMGGANLDTPDYNGSTALSVATRYQKREVLQFLSEITTNKN